jgi:hypothetical protein
MESSKIEIWKDIKGYEGLYQVSNRGRVRRIFFINNVTEKEKIKVLTPLKHNHGYLSVSLCKNGKQKMRLIHRLVAQAFIENKFNKKEINHINGNKKDNRVENLEWVTRKENMEHVINVLKYHLGPVGKFGADSKRAIPVLMIDKETNEVIKRFGSIIDGARYLNLTKSGDIVNCCKRKLKSSHGYIWRYEREILNDTQLETKAIKY